LASTGRSNEKSDSRAEAASRPGSGGDEGGMPEDAGWAEEGHMESMV